MVLNDWFLSDVLSVQLVVELLAGEPHVSHWVQHMEHFLSHVPNVLQAQGNIQIVTVFSGRGLEELEADLLTNNDLVKHSDWAVQYDVVSEEHRFHKVENIKGLLVIVEEKQEEVNK